MSLSLSNTYIHNEHKLKCAKQFIHTYTHIYIEKVSLILFKYTSRNSMVYRCMSLNLYSRGSCLAFDRL